MDSPENPTGEQEMKEKSDLWKWIHGRLFSDTFGVPYRDPSAQTKVYDRIGELSVLSQTESLAHTPLKTNVLRAKIMDHLNTPRTNTIQSQVLQRFVNCIETAERFGFRTNPPEEEKEG